MKTIKGIAMLLIATSMFVGCKQTSNEQKENKTDSLTNTEKVSSVETTGVMQKATFQVEGMSCAVGCAKVIEGKLAKMDGVKEAKVDFESKTATVEFDDAKQNPDAIKKMVEEIAKGAYKVENMSVSKEIAMVDQDDKTTKKKCCSSKKDGKSCGEKKTTDGKKDGCCSKDKKTTSKNII